MKQIGAEIGVNESRVSQLHARAIRRLREALEKMMPVAEAREALRGAILEFQQKPKMAKAVAGPAIVVSHPSAVRSMGRKAGVKGGVRKAVAPKMPRRSAAELVAAAR